MINSCIFLITIISIFTNKDYFQNIQQLNSNFAFSRCASLYVFKSSIGCYCIGNVMRSENIQIMGTSTKINMPVQFYSNVLVFTSLLQNHYQRNLKI